MKYISQNNSIGANKSNNKRCFSANGFSLLPLALRLRLFCLVGIIVGLSFGVFVLNSSAFALDPCSDLTAPCLNVSIANSIALDLKPISNTGTFNKSDTSTNTVSVMTNYFAGYALGIAASSTGTDAANLVQTSGEGNEQTVVGRISSIGTVSGVTSSGITEQEFSSDSNTQYNNTWGLKLTKLNTSEGGNYLPAPTTTTAITLDTTNIANPETANNYNIAIGARVDAGIPKGSYANTFVITAVANPIPYSIAYNKNTEDTVANMPTTTSGSTSDTSITLPNTKPTRSGYAFSGWCSVIPTTSGSADSCSGNTYYQDGTGSRTFPISQISDNTGITLYAMWQEVHNITFTAGNNIDTIIVADGSNKWRPYYASGGASVSRTVPVGTKLAVTVVPVANYILDLWTSSSGSIANLTDATLLTTTYMVGSVDETLTATGKSGEYTIMQNIDLSIKDQNNPDESINCPTVGINVTDFRDKKSYTVAKFDNYCYMLSNLRLDNTTDGTTPRKLTSADSDITPNTTYTEFIMPTEIWSSGSQNYYCKAIMKHYNQGSGNNYSNEYYYNWYAAKANPYQCDDPTTSTNATSINDGLALGSICPAGWKLPTYNDITAATLWDSGNNPGLVATFGNFDSGFQHYFGGYGYWWSSARYGENIARNLTFRGASADLYSLLNKYHGFSVRCMRSN